MDDYKERALNLIDSTKNNIWTQLNEMYIHGYEDGKRASCDCKDTMEAEYNRGLSDAWEFVQKLVKNESDGGYTASLLHNAFGYCNISSIVLRYGINEAIAKIKEYEEQQRQDTEIKVWDEVYSEMNDLRFIVTRITTSKHMDITVKRYEGICTDGACYDNLPEDIVKTGRTFPQISEVLEKMRGDKE